MDISGFYGGSKLLSFLVPWVGLSVDKINFIICQLIAIGLGQPFQIFFPSAERPSQNRSRYIAAAAMGAGLCLFSFGYQIVHLIVQAAVCQLLIHYAPVTRARYLVCAFSIGYLSFCHLMRLYYDYAGFTMDITGPLMIQTQRLSALAFNLHDGSIVSGSDEEEKAKLTPAMRLHLVSYRPTMLQFWTYILHFQGILVGPFVFYSDFKHFMDGTVPLPEGMEKRVHDQYLLGRKRILTVSLWVVFYASISLTLPSKLPPEFVIDDQYASMSMLYKWLYLTATCFVIRQRYYFAWALGELCYLCSGCGFSGLNPKTGEPEYKIVQNFDFFGVELASSTKVAIDSWNIGTAHWLRECIYERVPSQYATMAVFAVSAAWHGFYPGYYFMFLSVAFFTFLARLVRKRVRPLITDTHSPLLLNAYHLLTGVCAITTLNYTATGFVLLEIPLILRFCRSVYFGVHIAAVVIFLVVQFMIPKQKAK